jgi:hypothetical protein
MNYSFSLDLDFLIVLVFLSKRLTFFMNSNVFLTSKTIEFSFFAFLVFVKN